MSLIGYARVSTAEQDLSLQLDALRASGASRIFEDRGVSGAKTERPGLNAALSFLREGDTLVVWKMDRLGRSMTHLLQTVADLEKRSVGLVPPKTLTPRRQQGWFLLAPWANSSGILFAKGRMRAARRHQGPERRSPAVAAQNGSPRRQLDGTQRVKIGKSALYTARNMTRMPPVRYLANWKVIKSAATFQKELGPKAASGRRWMPPIIPDRLREEGEPITLKG